MVGLPTVIEQRDKQAKHTRFSPWSDCQRPLPEIRMLLLERPLSSVTVERPSGSSTQYRVKS